MTQHVFRQNKQALSQQQRRGSVQNAESKGTRKHMASTAERNQQRRGRDDKIHMFTKSSQSISQVHVKLEAEGNEEGAGGE